MREVGLVSLPVLEDQKVQGLITISDIAYADMDVYDNEILAKAQTPYKNLLETLNGSMLVEMRMM
jgi:manganese-dependent inorganic pyrophosphatase